MWQIVKQQIQKQTLAQLLDIISEPLFFYQNTNMSYLLLLFGL